MSGGGKAATFAAGVFALAGAAIAAYVYRDQIQETFESPNSALLRRCDAALSNLEKGLHELETKKNDLQKGGMMKKMLGHCQLDLDFITQTLDNLKLTAAEAGLKITRKQLVERTNVAAEKLEALHTQFFKP